MSASTFQQANVVYAMCLALAKLNDEPDLSTNLLAVAVRLTHPDVPMPVLRLIAAKVFRLYYEPFSLANINIYHELDDGDAIAACKFLRSAYMAEAAELRKERLGRSRLRLVSAAQ